MKKLLLAKAAFCCLATSANACGGTTTPKLCYSRVYDAAHLAKHPEQTISGMRMSLPSDSFDFDLSIQFRGDKDKWAWNVSGICNDFGPGMICGVILDGCEPSGDGKHFYITYDKNRTSLYLYPKQIPLEIVSDKLGDNKNRILTEGKDDKIFRLDKTVCWKEEK